MTDTAPISPQPDGGWVLVRRELSDELLRVALATDNPALYRDTLHHPANGPKGRLHAEERIVRERTRWTNLLSASPTPSDEDWDRCSAAFWSRLKELTNKGPTPPHASRDALKAALAALEKRP